MSHNRQTVFTTRMPNFKTPKGKKKRYTPSFSRLRKFVEFSLGQNSVFLVIDRGKQEQIQFGRFQTDQLKFHINYMLSTFSCVHEAYINQEQFFKCNTKDLKMSQNYNRKANEQTYIRKSTRCLKFHWHPGHQKKRYFLL